MKSSIPVEEFLYRKFSPSFAKVTQTRDDIRLVVKTIINPACYLVLKMRFLHLVETTKSLTTRRLGYFPQNALKPSGAEI